MFTGNSGKPAWPGGQLLLAAACLLMLSACPAGGSGAGSGKELSKAQLADIALNAEVNGFKDLKRFDGNYPDFWPSMIELPPDCYINHGGSITLNTGNKVPDIAVMGLMPGSLADCSKFFEEQFSPDSCVVSTVDGRFTLEPHGVADSRGKGYFTLGPQDVIQAPDGSRYIFDVYVLEHGKGIFTQASPSLYNGWCRFRVWLLPPPN